MLSDRGKLLSFAPNPQAFDRTLIKHIQQKGQTDRVVPNERGLARCQLNRFRSALAGETILIRRRALGRTLAKNNRRFVARHWGDSQRYPDNAVASQQIQKRTIKANSGEPLQQSDRWRGESQEQGYLPSRMRRDILTITVKRGEPSAKAAGRLETETHADVAELADALDSGSSVR